MLSFAVYICISRLRVKPRGPKKKKRQPVYSCVLLAQPMEKFTSATKALFEKGDSERAVGISGRVLSGYFAAALASNLSLSR